jgi:hypothetical protein
MKVHTASTIFRRLALGLATLTFSLSVVAMPKPMSDEQASNLVERTYQYVAMYNVNNKFAMDADLPMNTGGWNKSKVTTELFDHRVQAIARPNNDTLYGAAMLDLRDEPVILTLPAFDSKYVSLMATGYDHYVNIPLSTLHGDFSAPITVMFYSARTGGVPAQLPAGVDQKFEMTGDFVSAVLRVMPHANEPTRLKGIQTAMQSVSVKTLAEYQGGKAKTTDVQFPPYGDTDTAVYADNFAEVMQFVVNHTTFDPDLEDDVRALSALAEAGIVPGQEQAAESKYRIDNQQLARLATEFAHSQRQIMVEADPEVMASHIPLMFQPKGQTRLETVQLVSVVGPIGQPFQEAAYMPVITTDGEPMNAQYDYVLRMTREQLPPVLAFWSVTLYDLESGFFIPNPHRKYSVGENAGYQLNAEGGIDIYISAEKPEGVPAENWLPINPGDQPLDMVMRLYNPELAALSGWKPQPLGKLN